MLNDLYASTGIPVDISYYILQQKNVPIDEESIQNGIVQEGEASDMKKEKKRGVHVLISTR